MIPTFQRLQQGEMTYTSDHHEQNEPRQVLGVGATQRHWRRGHLEDTPEEMMLELNLEKGGHFHR